MYARRSLKSGSTYRKTAGGKALMARRQKRILGRISRPMGMAAFTTAGAEIKAIDIAAANYAFREPGIASNVILLNGVQNGSAFYQRGGSRIEMKNLHIRGQVTNLATSVGTSLRLLIVYDRQPTGALPTIATILQSRDQAGTASTSGFSEINLDRRARFSILRDMQFYCPNVTNTAGVLTNGPNFPGDDDQNFDINEFIKLKGLATFYSATAAPTTIVEISTGALYACFVATTTDTTWNCAAAFRLRYDDL